MKGLILVNIGTPASCCKTDVEDFIGEMFSDAHVLGQSEKVSKFLAHKVIAPLSKNKSLKKYTQIWRKEEPTISPLLYYMRCLAEKIESQKNIPVEICMRYGKPDFETALQQLEKKCHRLHEVIIFPLYPQYARTTTQTTIDAIGKEFYKVNHPYRLKIIRPYYNHPAYIEAVSKHALPYLDQKFDKWVFCYHSLPLKQVEEGWKRGNEFDYVYQLKETNRLIANELRISPKDIILLYASHQNSNWLKPFLSTDIKDLPKLGWKKITAIAPGFVTDNIDTLYNIDIEARNLFLDAGGEEFTFIPSLNDSEYWVDAIYKIISTHE